MEESREGSSRRCEKDRDIRDRDQFDPAKGVDLPSIVHAHRCNTRMFAPVATFHFYSTESPLGSIDDLCVRERW